MDTVSLVGGLGTGGLVGSMLTFLALKKGSKSATSFGCNDTVLYEMLDYVAEGAGLMRSSGQWLYANKALRTMFALGDKHIGHIEPDRLPTIEYKGKKARLDQFLKEGVRYLEGGKRWTPVPQCTLYRHDAREGTKITLYVKKVDTGSGELEIFALVAVDLSDHEAQMCKEHTHQLTGLPNEIQAKKDINKIFAQIHLDKKKLAVLMVELDNYSQIRSMLGHEQAEKQLTQVAKYLRQEAGKIGGYAYHMFTNVFMVVLPKIDGDIQVKNFYRKVEDQLENFYEVDGIKLHLSASVGAAIYPDGGSTLTLLDNAFKALYEAQKDGFGKIRFSHQIKNLDRYDEMELYSSLHQAIENEEFEIYYQPIVRANNQEIVAAEALIRWKHPKYSFIPPDLFVPMLEKSGYIVELGRYVLASVLKQIKRWEMFKFRPVQISINMSLIELESDGLVKNVTDQLEAHHVHPEFIKFEITEGIAMQNEAVLHERLASLKKLGIAIALDDFGTGYTSFAYLKRIPAGMVKIDRSMVMHILDSKEDERIVQAMIDLAHNLDMKVVVEGVEDEWMMKKLIELDADYLQGYYFSKPLPAFEFQEMIRFESKHLASEEKFLK